MKNVVIILGGIVSFILFLAYSESNEIAVNENAEVVGIISKLKEYAQSDIFWKRQLILVMHEIREEELFPIRMAELEGNLNKIIIEAQESMQKFYDENPSLKLDISEAQKQANALREKADDIEQREMDSVREEIQIERIKMLKSVKAAIEEVIDGDST